MSSYSMNSMCISHKDLPASTVSLLLITKVSCSATTYPCQKKFSEKKTNRQLFLNSSGIQVVQTL